MKIKVVREIFSEESTIGKLYIDEKFICYTLEDKDRDLKQDDLLEDIKKRKKFSITAIPYGVYKVVLTLSNRFKKILPEILNVPGYAGVRIHSGNSSKDTEGCILLGLTYSKDTVSNSRIAFDKVMNILTKAKGLIEIEIIKK